MINIAIILIDAYNISNIEDNIEDDLVESIQMLLDIIRKLKRANLSFFSFAIWKLKKKNLYLFYRNLAK